MATASFARDLHDDTDPKDKPEVETEEEETEGGEGGSGEGGDSRPESELTDEEKEARRQRNRDRKERKKANDRALVESNKILTERIRRLEQGQAETRTEVADTQVETGRAKLRSAITEIDAAIAEADRAIEAGEEAQATALASGDAGAIKTANRGLREAIERKFAAASEKREVEGISAEFERRAKAPNRRPTQGADPRITEQFDRFRAQHDWFDTDDIDRSVVQAVDKKLMAEGKLDPRTDEYWLELNRRIKPRLGHRFTSGRAETGDEEEERPEGSRRSAPPAGGPGRSKSPGGGEKWTLDKARKNAMEREGLREGTDEWNERVTVYKDWDAEESKRRAS